MAVVMSKNNKDQDSDTSRENQLRSDISDLQECFTDIKEIFDSEAKKPSKSDDNVVYIAPSIFREFDSLKEIPMPAEKVVSLYLEWAERLYVVVALNKGHYRNHAISTHMQNLYSLLKTIENIFTKNK
jgi:hypothetical protein